jgi:hypothetical protein
MFVQSLDAELANCVRELLDRDTQLWNPEQWLQAFGLEPVRWATRLKPSE